VVVRQDYRVVYKVNMGSCGYCSKRPRVAWRKGNLPVGVGVDRCITYTIYITEHKRKFGVQVVPGCTWLYIFRKYNEKRPFGSHNLASIGMFATRHMTLT
jgi:hypothetical protein